MATLTVPERELWEWGRKQEPMKVGCILGSYVIGVDLDLELYRIQQHIKQCLEPAPQRHSDPPVTCTHTGAGAPFPSRFNALVADVSGPDGARWTAEALARAITEQGVPVLPHFVAGVSSGDRHAEPSFVAAVARIFDVPVSYFQGRAVRVGTDPATGGQVVVEELRDSAGVPHPYPVPALRLAAQ